jgi:hypothetical protein
MYRRKKDGTVARFGNARNILKCGSANNTENIFNGLFYRIFLFVKK